MVKFSYKAVTSTGELVEGEIDAATRQAVVTWLHEQGQTPIRAHVLNDRVGRAFTTRFRIGTDRVSDALSHSLPGSLRPCSVRACRSIVRLLSSTTARRSRERDALSRTFWIPFAQACRCPKPCFTAGFAAPVL